MIDFLLTLLKVAAATAPTALLCLASGKLNLKPPYRIRQFLMPVFAFIYVLGTMIFAKQICDGMAMLLREIPNWIGALGGLSWLPEGVSNVINWISTQLKAFINGLNLDFWVFFVANLAMIAGYLVYKKIVISVLNQKFKRGGELMTRIGGIFYEYFAEKDVWCLKNNYVDARTLLRSFYAVGLIVSFLVMMISRWLYFNQMLSSVFFPVFGVILLGEICFFLGGITKQEYANSYLGETEDSFRTVNYSLLRKFLRTIFGDKLGSENTTVNSGSDYSFTNDELIEKLERDEDAKIATFGAYVRSLNNKGFALNHNSIHSTVELLKGKSILFNNPFYYDLIPYAFYPMNRALLSHKKVLVVLGRHAIEEDIARWLKKGIGMVTNIPDMWNIGVLSENADETLDIGIVSRSDVLNTALLEVNAAFLEQVGFFVIIEPSRLVSTAQLGLNLMIKRCHADKSKDIVFCMCDKNCDGLVDAMSHILMTSITEVSATDKHTGSSSYMTWNADSDYLHHRLFPNVSRYLGIGTELSFAGLKNQVSRTVWYGGESFPVTDMKWIDRQYYYELMQYAGLPANQEFMDEVFVTSSGYWDAEVRKYNYITAEDENCNMFEAIRDFSTRASEQGFINIISREYMLKDYMISNHGVFETDSKAIPYISADYARTRRNVTLRILLKMANEGISEGNLKKEFSLMGSELTLCREQLWYEIYCCYADVAAVAALSELSYNEAVAQVAKESILLPGLSPIGISVISADEEFNLNRGCYENIYRITDRGFIHNYVSELRSAGYIAEDEKGNRYYLGSELKGHIFQNYLPGQFFTFGGKYYEMQSLTSDNQVLVRRAADHITDRCSYRQIREYRLPGFADSHKMGSAKTISGVRVVRQYADIAVSTKGYYKMSEYNNFDTAKEVIFGENGRIPDRVYKNKELLRIDFPAGKNISDRVRYTITLMFNEVFRTLFAENQPFIAAVTDLSFITNTQDCNPMTYSIASDSDAFSKNSIYIIEDSQLDLGLLIAVERNLSRIFDIITDYIDWHLNEMKESLSPKKIEKIQPIRVEPEGETGDGEEKPRGLWARIKSFFKRGKKKKPEPPTDDDTKKPEPPTDDEPQKPEPPTDDTETLEPYQPKPLPPTEETETGEPVIPVPQNPTDDSDLLTPYRPQPLPPVDNNGDGVVTETQPPANCFRRKKKPIQVTLQPEQPEDTPPVLFKKAPYHTRYYLLYGQKGEPALLDVKSTAKFLSEVFNNQHNTLRQVREGRKIAQTIERCYRPNRANVRYCDFCGVEILGVEYETLVDGRDRCINCSRTAVKTTEELIKIFDGVKRNMESSFGIRINAGIKVEMVNARTLQKESGHVFIPSRGMDPRVVGLAVHDKNGFRLLVENGSPRIRTILTIAHELTHIWQYQNWNKKAIRKLYGRKLELEIYEGMAKWAEIQYAYLINEVSIAKREEILTAYRQDEYGRGFLRYRLDYPLTMDTVITGRTPFMYPDRPLSLDCCGEVFIPEEFLSVPRPPQDDPDDEIDFGGLFGEEDPQEVAEDAVFEGEHLRNPNELTYGCYNNLSGIEKEVYDIFYRAMLDRVADVHLDDAHKITSKRASVVVHAVWYDHPELIWVAWSFAYRAGMEELQDFTFMYTLSEEETKNRMEAIEAALPAFMEGVTDEMCDFEAVLRVYNRLIELVDYDSLGLEKEKKNQRDRNTPDDLRSVYGILVNRKGVCAGYSLAFAFLMQRLGIECMYTGGYALSDDGKRFSEPHAWNIIKLENEYYLMDVTWGDFSNTKPEKDRKTEPSYKYFCVTSQEMSKNHKPDDDSPFYPECTATACNYYIRTGLYLEAYDFERVKSIILKTVENRRKTVEIKFSDSVEQKKAAKHLIDNSHFYDILQAVNLKLGKVVDSTGFSYSVNEESPIVKFVLKYLS